MKPKEILEYISKRKYGGASDGEINALEKVNGMLQKEEDDDGVKVVEEILAMKEMMEGMTVVINTSMNNILESIKELDKKVTSGFQNLSYFDDMREIAGSSDV